MRASELVRFIVAPFAGVWINNKNQVIVKGVRRTLRGVWIEIL